MAHSHQKFRNAGRNRVAHILASGGCAKPAHKKTGGSAGMRYKHAMPDEPDLEAEGTKRGKRFARGGGLKKPKHQTNIAIVIPHHVQAGPPPGGMPPGAQGAPPPGMGGPAMPPPMGTGMPVAPPGALPMRARGGMITNQHGGAATGVNRLQEYEKRRGH
jgi:hypothetical protein